MKIPKRKWSLAFVLGIFYEWCIFSISHRGIQNDVTDVHRCFPDFLQYSPILDRVIEIHKTFEKKFNQKCFAIFNSSGFALIFSFMDFFNATGFIFVKMLFFLLISPFVSMIISELFVSVSFNSVLCKKFSYIPKRAMNCWILRYRFKMRFSAKNSAYMASFKMSDFENFS